MSTNIVPFPGLKQLVIHIGNANKGVSYAVGPLGSISTVPVSHAPATVPKEVAEGFDSFSRIGRTFPGGNDRIADLVRTLFKATAEFETVVVSYRGGVYCESRPPE